MSYEELTDEQVAKVASLYFKRWGDGFNLLKERKEQVLNALNDIPDDFVLTIGVPPFIGDTALNVSVAIWKKVIENHNVKKQTV
jgi:hypothetical protein